MTNALVTSPFHWLRKSIKLTSLKGIEFCPQSKESFRYSELLYQRGWSPTAHRFFVLLKGWLGDTLVFETPRRWIVHCSTWHFFVQCMLIYFCKAIFSLWKIKSQDGKSGQWPAVPLCVDTSYWLLSFFFFEERVTIFAAISPCFLNSISLKIQFNFQHLYPVLHSSHLLHVSLFTKMNRFQIWRNLALQFHIRSQTLLCLGNHKTIMKPGIYSSDCGGIQCFTKVCGLQLLFLSRGESVDHGRLAEIYILCKRSSWVHISPLDRSVRLKW